MIVVGVIAAIVLTVALIVGIELLDYCFSQDRRRRLLPRSEATTAPGMTATAGADYLRDWPLERTHSLDELIDQVRS